MCLLGTPSRPTMCGPMMAGPWGCTGSHMASSATTSRANGLWCCSYMASHSQACPLHSSTQTRALLTSWQMLVRETQHSAACSQRAQLLACQCFCAIICSCSSAPPFSCWIRSGTTLLRTRVPDCTCAAWQFLWQSRLQLFEPLCAHRQQCLRMCPPTAPTSMLGCIAAAGAGAAACNPAPAQIW